MPTEFSKTSWGEGRYLQTRDNTMANKLMYIPFDDKQYYPLCKLQLLVETFGHSTI